MEPFISTVPNSNFEDIRPTRSLLEEIRGNHLIRTACPRIDSIADDVEVKATELRFDEDAEQLAQLMDDNCLAAIVAYTHDTGRKDGSLYFELNNSLRERTIDGRETVMRTWGVVAHFVLKGLSRLEAVCSVVYRGLPEKETVLKQYKLGRPIQWGAFTSTSLSRDTAKRFLAGSKDSSIILKIVVTTGRKLGPLSFFPSEDEVLLSPRCRFVVSSLPYTEDGYTFLELVEQQGELYIF